MERVVFRPGDVRGGGNVISPSKGLSDFEKYNCKLEKSTTTIDSQTVNTFKETYLPGSYFEMDYTNWYDSSAEEFEVTGVLKKQSDGSVIASSSVRCIVNDALFDTGTTDNSGEVTFTIPSFDEFLYQVKLVFEGTNSIAGCTGYAVVHVGDLDSIILRSQSNVVGEGDSNWLCAELLGVDGYGNTIPVPYLDVEFLEEYTPGVRVRSNQKTFQTGDNVTLTAELYDTSDGSRVCLAGETLEIYEEYTPGLKVSSSTPVTEDGDEPITLTAQLIDAVDGSLVMLEGESVEILEEYTPALRVGAEKLVIAKGEAVTVSARLVDAEDGSFVMQDGELIEVGGDAGWVPETVTVDLSVSSSNVNIGSNVTFSATVENAGTPVSGVTVTFYEGSTTLGTGTTNSSGVATFTTNSLTAGTHNVVAVYSVVESTNKSVSVNKLVSILSLSATRKVLFYGEVSTFTVTLGTETNAPGGYSSTPSPLSGKTVKLYRGNTLIDTLTTNSQGKATYTTASTLDAGEYQFKAVYEGDSTYASVTSQIMNVTIKKAVPSMTFTSSEDTVEVGETLTLSGALSFGAGETVQIYENYTLFATLTTGTGGAFSTTRSPSSSGAKRYLAVYEGDSNHAGTTKTVDVNVLNPFVPTSLSVTSSKDVVSYYDGESALLSAVVRDEHDDLLPDVTVSFKVDDVVVGSDVTNSEGVAVYSYRAVAAGDVTISVECGLLQETYSIEDLYWYSSNGTGLSGIYSVGTDSSYTYVTSLASDVVFPAIPSGDFELSMKAYRPTSRSNRNLLLEVGVSKNDTLLCGWDTGTSDSAKNVRIYKRSGNSNASIENNTNPSYNNGEWIDFKIRYENGTVTLTVGGTSISTTFSTVSRIGNYITSYSRLSQLKIKTL